MIVGLGRGVVQSSSQRSTRAGSVPHYRGWVGDQLGKFSGLREIVGDRFDRGDIVDDIEANTALRVLAGSNEINEPVIAAGLQHIRIKWDMSREQLEATAEELAHICKVVVEHGNDKEAQVKRVCQVADVGHVFPLPAWERKTVNARWWRGVLRRESGRRTEQKLRGLGLVSKKTGLYLSEFTFAGWVAGQRRAADLMDGAELVDSQTGEILALSDAAAAGVASLENRRAELMTRIRGQGEIAEHFGLVPLFLTLTCPSKYHLYSGGGKNSKYNESSPREAQQYLCLVWSRIRSHLARLDVGLFGTRVVEPHHDGCPHWHMLLFVESRHKYDLLEVIKGYSLEEDGGERGAEQRRVEMVELSSCGDAAGYVAKYISKNVDGFGVGEDYESEGKSTIDTSLRVRAWASLWGIRQFDSLGDASVTCYRELRRVAADAGKAAEVDSMAVDAMKGADDGDWFAYSMANGGPFCALKDRPVRPYYSEIRPVSGSKRVGAYGEIIKAVVGFYTVARVTVSRWREWVLNFKGASPPWSRVNNCISEVGQSSYGMVMQC